MRYPIICFAVASLISVVWISLELPWWTCLAIGALAGMIAPTIEDWRERFGGPPEI